MATKKTSKASKKSAKKHYRSAESGKMVSKKFAEANPKTTVSERSRKK